jgi:hypothetical protein
MESGNIQSADAVGRAGDASADAIMAGILSIAAGTVVSALFVWVLLLVLPNVLPISLVAPLFFGLFFVGFFVSFFAGLGVMDAFETPRSSKLSHIAKSVVDGFEAAPRLCGGRARRRLRSTHQWLAGFPRRWRR